MAEDILQIVGHLQSFRDQHRGVDLHFGIGLPATHAAALGVLGDDNLRLRDGQLEPCLPGIVSDAVEDSAIVELDADRMLVKAAQPLPLALPGMPADAVEGCQLRDLAPPDR